MKRSILLLILGVSLFVGVMDVKALTLKDGNKTHVINEIEAECSTFGLFEYGVDKDGNILMHDNRDKYIKVTPEGKCINLNNQEILDMYNNYGQSHFEVNANDNGVYSIYEVNYAEYYYIPTEDSEFVVGKEYCEYQGGSFICSDGYSGPIEGEYYELVALQRPDSAVLDKSGKTNYYIEDTDFSNNLVYKYVPVSELDDNNLLNYRIVRKNFIEREKAADINQKVFKEMLDNGGYAEIDNIGDKYYLSFEKDNNNWPFTYTVYTSDGKLFVDDVNNFNLLANDLYSVGVDGVVKIYNMKHELLGTIDNIDNLMQLDFKNQKGILASYDNTNMTYRYYTLNVYEIVKDDNLKNEEVNANGNNISLVNPDTSDGIVMYFIITILAVIGLVGVTIYLKKKSNIRA